MPNILIVGFNPFEAKAVQETVEDVVKLIGVADDSITTILPAETKWCAKQHRAPYLVVRSVDYREAQAIAFALHRKLQGAVDIEYEKVDGFIAGVPPKTEIPT